MRNGVSTRALIVGTLVALGVSVGSAHMALQRSLPEEDAVLTTPPPHIRLWFTQDPDPAVTAVTLTGETGDIPLGEPTVGAEHTVTAEVPPLSPGDYTVGWRSAGDDGHVQRGEFSFRVQSAN